MNAPHVQRSVTSELAAHSMHGHLERLQIMVLSVLSRLEGQCGTDEEIADRMPPEVKDSTTRARRIALTQLGYIEDSGTTKKGSSGRLMTVWRLAAPKEEQSNLAI